MLDNGCGTVGSAVTSIPEDAVSNPVTGILVTVSRKDENEFKEAGKGSVKTLLFI